MPLTRHLSVDNQVKLHWLPPSEEMGRLGNKNSTIQFTNGNQLETIKAGHSVAFECGAAAEPKPRIRWFRLLPISGLGVGSSAVVFSQHRQSSNGRDLLIHSKLDESHMRTILMQDNIMQIGSQFYQIELPIRQSSLTKGGYGSGARTVPKRRR